MTNMTTNKATTTPIAGDGKWVANALPANRKTWLVSRFRSLAKMESRKNAQIRQNH